MNISGRRHIPKLVNACKFPFLRIKKPQPARLSRIISDSIQARESRTLQSQKLQKQITLAKSEDLWDKVLSEKLGVSEDAGAESWVAAPQAALRDVRQVHDRALKKRMEVALQMTDIVEKENALAAKERSDIKHKERVVRRLERQGSEPSLA